MARAAQSLRIKNHFVAFIGEFVGTFLFLFFAFGGTQTANLSSSQDITGPNLPQLLYISLIFGFSLAINVWVFFRVSGGLFNPAVTLALCVLGVNPIVRSIVIVLAQILGAIVAAAIVKGLIPGDSVAFNVVLAPNVSIAQGLFLEMFMTVLLVFTILMLAAEKTKATFVAPVGIGLALFVAEMLGVYWTGGALNPARAFGPAVVKPGFNGYHWIYWLGPVMGALLSAGFYKLLKVLRYEEVNGDQDKAADEEANLEREERPVDHDLEAGRPSNSMSSTLKEKLSHHSQNNANGNGTGNVNGTTNNTNGGDRMTSFIKGSRQSWKRKVASRRTTDSSQNQNTYGQQRQPEDVGFATPKAQRRSFYDEPPNPPPKNAAPVNGNARIDPTSTVPNPAARAGNGNIDRDVDVPAPLFSSPAPTHPTAHSNGPRSRTESPYRSTNAVNAGAGPVADGTRPQPIQSDSERHLEVERSLEEGDEENVIRLNNRRDSIMDRSHPLGSHPARGDRDFNKFGSGPRREMEEGAW